MTIELILEVLQRTEMHSKKAMDYMCKWHRMCLIPSKYFEAPKCIRRKQCIALCVSDIECIWCLWNTSEVSNPLFCPFKCETGRQIYWCHQRCPLTLASPAVIRLWQLSESVQRSDNQCRLFVPSCWVNQRRSHSAPWVLTWTHSHFLPSGHLHSYLRLWCIFMYPSHLQL